MYGNKVFNLSLIKLKFENLIKQKKFRLHHLNKKKDFKKLH